MELTSYLYCEPITERMFIVCNAGMVYMESCLLTSLVWRDNSYVCPPKVAELMLEKADALGKSITFDNKYVGTLYESIMTTGCVDSIKSQCLEGGQVRAEQTKSRWFANSELSPLAPANYNKVTTKSAVGDVMSLIGASATCDLQEKDEVTVPTSKELKLLDYVILVVHSEGNMEVAYAQTSGCQVDFGNSFSQNIYRFAHHLKVLIYGTLYDYTNKMPKLMASVIYDIIATSDNHRVCKSCTEFKRPL
jgi:hypothetical protein